MDLVKEALAKEIANKLKHTNVLLEAPMGWGKTTLMLRLSVLLAKEGYKVGLIAPTLTLLVKKWPQLLELLQREPNPPRAILSAGAGQYCVYKWENPQKHCHRCRLRRNFAINTPVVTYEEIEKMVPEDVCGYWAQETSLDRYDVILGHYGRLPKIARYIHYLLVDEAQELFYLPHIASYNLHDIATLLGVDVEELNLDVIRELVEEKMLVSDPLVEDKLWTLRNALRKTCWIENETLHCLDLYNPPRVRTFAATATPPPGWPPREWGEKIEIEPQVRPQAYVEPEARFYFKDRYEGASLMLHLAVNWLRREHKIEDIAVFATSSLRQVLQYSLPPGVELFPMLRQPGG
jgi:hypothetical protein